MTTQDLLRLPLPERSAWARCALLVAESYGCSALLREVLQALADSTWTAFDLLHPEAALDINLTRRSLLHSFLLEFGPEVERTLRHHAPS